MSKKEYCDKFGLDHKINMTAISYHIKMRNYAYKYNMDKQVLEAGKQTRFKKGHDRTYKRSYQTNKRLSELGTRIGYTNLKKRKE